MGDVLPSRRPPEEDGVPTRPCSQCGHAVLPDAARCRHCGAQLGFRGIRLRRVPWWMWFGLILILVIILGWLFGE
jgi:predicted nucleic acid-binding Zn ribbon protein